MEIKRKIIPVTMSLLLGVGALGVASAAMPVDTQNTVTNQQLKDTAEHKQDQTNVKTIKETEGIIKDDSNQVKEPKADNLEGNKKSQIEVTKEPLLTAKPQHSTNGSQPELLNQNRQDPVNHNHQDIANHNHQENGCDWEHYNDENHQELKVQQKNQLNYQEQHREQNNWNHDMPHKNDNQTRKSGMHH